MVLATRQILAKRQMALTVTPFPRRERTHSGPKTVLLATTSLTTVLFLLLYTWDVARLRSFLEDSTFFG